MSSGSSQLFVGPASSSRREQMNVRSSTRATSSGSERARYELGRLASERRSNVPLSTRTWHSESYSSAEPSHQWTRSGLVSSATSSTQASSRSCLVGTVISLATLVSLLKVRRIGWRCTPLCGPSLYVQPESLSHQRPCDQTPTWRGAPRV